MDLRLRCQMQTIKLLEHNIGGNLGAPGVGDELLDTIKAQSMKENTKLDLIKFKISALQKIQLRK